MKNATSRYQNSEATNNLRFVNESTMNKDLTVKGSFIMPGQFRVILSNPPQMTHRLLNNFCANGQVLFYPETAADHPDLNAFLEADGAINLSAVYLAKEKPEDVTDESWASYKEKVKAIFKVLRDDCISPMQRIVADVQRSFGFGAPKIHKKFGGDIETQTAAEVDVVDVMNKLLEQLGSTTENG